MKHKYLLCIVFFLCFLFSAFGQEDLNPDPSAAQASNDSDDLEASSVDASQNIMLARSSDDYLVTPGDVYTLVYSVSGNSVSYTIAVDSTYRIRVSNMGIVNGDGKTFVQLKREVENIVTNNIPLSGVQLVLTQPAVFRVFVKGEVLSAREVSAWSLSRLSSLTGGNLTPRASIRDITIKSSNGRIRVYDLFKARRMGDLSQNPYLRPGDEITFNRISRVVTINGSVERPGRYQILEGENLKNLIEVYANNFTPLADKTRVRLTRYIDSTEISGDIILLSEQNITGNYPLQHLDVITVPAITARRPAVPMNRVERTITISGAVRRPGTYELMPDENLKELIEVYGDGITPLADMSRVSLRRFVEVSEVSGEITLLSEQDIAGNYPLRHLDSITIPDITDLRPAIRVNRMERRITIAGAVRRPGTYDLMPHENLKELIEVYGDGFTPLADPTRMEMVRMLNSDEVSGTRIFLTETDVTANFTLENFDSVIVPSIVQLRPVMFVEGAVTDISRMLDNMEAEIGGVAQDLTESRRLVVQFVVGETYASLVQRNVRWFTAVSDPQNAYIVRDGARIPINLNLALYDVSYRDQTLIRENDVLIIPFRQQFISVAGAVIRPGRYPYIPDRDWEYYIGLAGGFIAERNSKESVVITDIYGKRLKKTDAITPETTITARNNHPLYFVNLVGPVITTALSIVSTIISVIILSR